MKKTMINKHRMLVAVLDFLDKNESKLTFAPALLGYVDSAQDTLARIGSTQEAQLSSSEGYTQTKEAIQQQVIGSMLDIIRRAKAFAFVTNDLILKQAVNYTYNKLNKLPQDSLIDVCNKIVSDCKPKVDLMADYGLTPAMLEAIEPELAAYAAALPGTKQVIASRKTATAELKVLFAEVDHTFKRIDALMDIISAADPLFYQEYKNLRVIDDLRRKSSSNGVKTTGIAGVVSNLETGLKQAGVLVSVVGTNFSTLTDAEGNYTLSLKEAGVYSLKAELKGYNDYEEEDIEVNQGEMTTVDFDMEPLA
ncbi:MAG: hypothetical protein CVU14_11370 [Bacteroidetes bacterium HGW-Bacteroidetes-9]|jgi:hypothetical protein|nr:MAG: hypothetical protein CVU14_11370 [Bacteroidetes bacterium HGW-Bacteroidetes-9]